MVLVPFMEDRPLDEEDGAEGHFQSNRVQIVQVGGKEDTRDDG